ncbi:MAG: Holliday junction branch migration protein RuvA [Oscillatoriales cyanobacterium]|nr:MAG: Holliday junction branch migration protein RuvA [Oscillatoriales cyanobacterium]
MIGYLRGEAIAITQTTANRTLLILEVGGIGYEIQILPRTIVQLPALGDTVKLFTHVQLRDEVPYLYGFISSAERDLFRQLIAVSGIGNQLAISLLDTLDLPELVQAIVTGNSRRLSQAPGVGKKTAERISLELRTKLAAWRSQSHLDDAPTIGIPPALGEDVEMTLLALGYSIDETIQAIGAIAVNPDVRESRDSEVWIKSAIAWLSRST